jgi:hypothetical protein
VLDEFGLSYGDWFEVAHAVATHPHEVFEALRTESSTDEVDT